MSRLTDLSIFDIDFIFHCEIFVVNYTTKAIICQNLKEESTLRAIRQT